MIEIQNIKLPKIIWAVFFTTLIVSLWVSSVRAEVPPPVNITVEGKTLAMPVPPVIVGDRTLVGVRSVGEAVGGNVQWDQARQQVTVIRRSDIIVLTVGKSTAQVNGKTVTLDAAPRIVSDRTMVPLRFIAEALGGTVEWDQATRTINILRKPSAVSSMVYTNAPDKGRVVLTFSEPLVSVTPRREGNTVALDLYPAGLAVSKPDQLPQDSLLRALHLQIIGRSVRFTAELNNQPNFRYIISSDGMQLTVEFDHSVTAYQLHQDNRISTLNIAATGKIAYQHFTLDNPPRVVVDVPGAHLDPGAPTALTVDDPYIAKVRAADRGDAGVRLVLDMKTSLAYDVVPTDNGLQIQFIPWIQAVKTEKLQGKTRITFTGTLPMDAKVTALPDQKQIRIEVPQGRSAVPGNSVKVADGTVDTITLAPGATPASSLITIALPYYMGHSVVSKTGDSSIVVDLITSPVYGKRIWIDAGHGKIPGAKDDPGSLGKTYGTYEKVVNLAVALELQKRLQAAGAVVFMTRTGDSGVDFTQRPDLVNALKPPADLFISIHHNSSTVLTVRGSETYYWTTNPKSRAAAVKVHAAVVKGLGFPDRSVRVQDYYVIKETKAPAILVELGYLSNAAEEKAIAEPGVVLKTYPAKAAEALKNGILDYFLAGN